MHQLLIDFKKTYDPVRKEDLYNILTRFGIRMNPTILRETCLTETYSGISLGKHLSDIFPDKKDLKQGHDISPLLFNSASEYNKRMDTKAQQNI